MATATAHLLSWTRSSSRTTDQVKNGLLVPLHRSISARPNVAKPRQAGVTRAAVKAVDPASPLPPLKKRSQYDITTFTTWLIRQEQDGRIDGELAIVLSSISLACKQIASLVQRAGISNLTGLQGVENIQGEEQKKLDVISNEVRLQELRVW